MKKTLVKTKYDSLITTLHVPCMVSFEEGMECRTLRLTDIKDGLAGVQFLTYEG